MRLLSNIVPAFVNALALAQNLVRSQGALAAENLFFRKQLTFFVDREQTPHRQRDAVRDGGAGLPWCTTPIEAESSLGPDSHHPIISLSGIPSAVMVLRILHPILASTLCGANPLARIAEPTIAL